MLVSELMTTRVETVTAGDSMKTAADLMAERDVGCLPIVDAERHLVGIVTDRDICLAAAARGEPLSTLAVSEAASVQTHAVCDTDSVAMAERIMRERRVRRLPVLDRARQLVGMLTLNDIARAGAAREWSGEGLSAYEVGETLATVSKPTAVARPGGRRA